MKPNPQKEKLLIATLGRWHGSKYGDLQIKGKQFADGLRSLPSFNVVQATHPSKHVGRVIVDGVLQVGKDYERQVRPAVYRILLFRQAATITGFIELLKSKPLKNIINFKTGNTKNDLLNVADFFQRQGINTFDE